MIPCGMNKVKLGYNKHGYNEFMAIACKWQLHVAFN